jgi:Holliday junction resolvasome RuvABC DNA-binding subunit
MSNPTITIHDLKSAEVITREMTKEELAQVEIDKANEQAKQAEQSAKKAARQSALDKLAALGLSPEEISAITGA